MKNSKNTKNTKNTIQEKISWEDIILRSNAVGSKISKQMKTELLSLISHNEMTPAELFDTDVSAYCKLWVMFHYMPQSSKHQFVANRLEELTSYYETHNNDQTMSEVSRNFSQGRFHNQLSSVEKKRDDAQLAFCKTLDSKIMVTWTCLRVAVKVSARKINVELLNLVCNETATAFDSQNGQFGQEDTAAYESQLNSLRAQLGI